MAYRGHHWKNRFDPDDKFVWAKSVLWGGSKSVVDEAIPQELFDNKYRLRNFWNAGTIRSSTFVAPNILTGRVDSAQVEATPEPAQKSDLAAGYNDLVKRARSLGMTGRNPTMAKLKAFISGVPA